MELKVISREIIQKAMEQDYLPHAEIFADEIAWMKDCVALLDEVDSLKEENNKLRGLLAAGQGDCVSGQGDCVYCGLPAADIAKCPHGFPGCARMDDIVNAPEMKLEVENAALFIELAALRWKPITPERLPKIGDEVGVWIESDRGVWNAHLPRIMTWKTRHVHRSDHKTFETWTAWTHFRPINPPKEEADGTEPEPAK
jgi:hypothetical protein